MLKRKIQLFFAYFFKAPILIKGKTSGYSLFKSERFDSEISKQATIYPPFILRHISIEKYSYVAKNSNINNTSIGKFCSIGPNVCIGLGIHPTIGVSTSPMFYSTSKVNGYSLVDKMKIKENQKTIIGNDVFVGANVTILDGVTIGDGAIVGAGAVVSKDVPPYAIVVGSPMKVIKYRFANDQIAALLRIGWWNWSEERLVNVADSEFDIDAFIERYDKI